MQPVLFGAQLICKKTRLLHNLPSAQIQLLLNRIVKANEHIGQVRVKAVS